MVVAMYSRELLRHIYRGAVAVPALDWLSAFLKIYKYQYRRWRYETVNDNETKWKKKKLCQMGKTFISALKCSLMNEFDILNFFCKVEIRRNVFHWIVFI
jgi:hypothetical protein